MNTNTATNIKIPDLADLASGLKTTLECQLRELETARATGSATVQIATSRYVASELEWCLEDVLRLALAHAKQLMAEPADLDRIRDISYIPTRLLDELTLCLSRAEGWIEKDPPGRRHPTLGAQCREVLDKVREAWK